MMNGDILSDINYSNLVEYHTSNKCMATVALKKRDVYVDFGVIDVDEDNNLRRYTEKPTIDYLVSMGICVFEPEVLDYIEPGKRLDFPDLVEQLMESRKKVKGYIHTGFWFDIGRPDDY